MDAHGFYSRHPCRNCGIMLQGEGDGTPAETYAGTYTGLCYRCSQLDKVVMKTSSLDGAMHISYAPLQPSWRRDRTYEIGYADCSACGGDGRIYKGYSNYSKHYDYCKVCRERYYNQPQRKAYLDHSAYLDRVLRTSSENAYSRNVEVRYPEYLKILPKAKKMKGRGRTKMFYRDRSIAWTTAIIDGTPDEVKLAIENTAYVYYTAYQVKKVALDQRLAKLYIVAIDDMKVDHPLYNGY